MEFDTIRSDVPGFTAAFESSVTTALGCSHGRVKSAAAYAFGLIVSEQIDSTETEGAETPSIFRK